MIGYNLKIEGAENLDRMLQALPVKVRRQVMRDALRDGAEPVLAEARARVPVRTGKVSSIIKAALGIIAARTGGRGLIGVAVATRKAWNDQLVKITKGRFATEGWRRVRLGTKAAGGRLYARVWKEGRKLKGGPRERRYYLPTLIEYGTRRMAAFSFMRGAMDSRAAEAVGRIVARLRIDLEALWAKGTP